MNLIRRSIFFSAVERYGNIFFFLFSTAVLARLLTPEEFGIFAVVNALTAVLTASFQEFGGANYLIQKQSLSEHDIRTAFTITFGISFLIGATLFSLRDELAWFFSQNGLKVGLAVSSLNLLVSPFLATVSALHRRNMAFETLARCNLIGSFFTAVISISLAALGYSFLAPILGTIAGNIVAATLLISSDRRLRIFRPSFAGHREVMHFGFYSSCVAIINVLYNFAPQLFLGRILDFTAVGLYSRAVSITQLFDRMVLQVFNPIIMPAVFTQTRAGGDLRRIYLDAIELITAVQWPFLLFLTLMANSIILIWLGPTWIEIVPLVRVLCVASLWSFAACLTFPILVATGHVRDALVSSLISLPPSLLVLFISSFFGVQAVAVSALLTLPFQAIVALHFVCRHLAMGPADLIRAMLRSGVVSVCSAASGLACIAIFELNPIGPIVGLLFASVSAGVGWWIGLVITKHPLLAHIPTPAGAMFFALRLSTTFAQRLIPVKSRNKNHGLALTEVRDFTQGDGQNLLKATGQDTVRRDPIEGGIQIVQPRLI